MTPDRWQQVEKLCQAALELEESRRKAFLDQVCAGDEELRREVESLLKFDRRGEQFIEEPALKVAAKMIAQDEPESLVGQQIGYYQILSLLGAGGMGVVYKARIPAPGADGKYSIQFLSFSTAKVKTVAPISGPYEGLSVSPDGRFILFSQVDEAGGDLMLVENFR